MHAFRQHRIPSYPAPPPRSRGKRWVGLLLLRYDLQGEYAARQVASEDEHRWERTSFDGDVPALSGCWWPRRLGTVVLGREFSGTRTGGLDRFSYKTPVAWKRTVVGQGETHCTLEFPPQNQEYVKVLLLRWEHVPRCHHRTTSKHKYTDVGVVCVPDIYKITQSTLRGQIRCSFVSSESSSLSSSAPFVRPRLVCLCRR